MTDIYSNAQTSARALFKFFNSIHIVLPSDDHIHGLAERMSQYWINEYVNWHQQMSAVSSHERLPSGFPILHIKGEHILQYDQAIESILRCGQNFGFALSAHITADDCQKNESRFTQLCETKTIKYLQVSLAEDTPNEFLLNLIELSDSYHFYLTLNIQTARLKSDFFFLEQLGGQNIQFIVDSEQNLTLLKSSADLYISSCVPNFILSIDENGNIFPCTGVVGVKSATLGTIYDDFSDTAFVRKNILLDLDALAKSGPDINTPQNLEKITISDRLPKMCSIHRFILENDHS